MSLPSEGKRVPGQKRSHESEIKSSLLNNINVILVDIEGTTTSISFVKETLFPYIREHVKSYLKGQWENKECQQDVQALRQLYFKDKAAGVEGAVEIVADTCGKEEVIQSAVANVTWQMNQDRKSTALKQLQGHIWRDGYQNGKVKGHLYKDVVDLLKSWLAEKKSVYVYSSGSIEAQKLLFTWSEYGDLTQYFAGNFDTTTGAKQEKDSYAKICKQVNSSPEKVLFFTDIVGEADAASSAGVTTCLVDRPGNAPLTKEAREKYTVIKSFAELKPSGDEDEPPAKKK